MIEMTDERAAEVLRDAIREGSYERNRVDPCGADGWEADCDSAIAHIEARLRSQPPAEAQAQVGGEVVAWRILWSPQFPETAELTSDGVRVQKVRALDDGPQIEPLYTAPPSAPVGVETEVQARESVALALDEAGYPAEAGNVRNGIDLDDYRVELSIARIALAQQPAAVDGATLREVARQMRTRYAPPIGHSTGPSADTIAHCAQDVAHALAKWADTIDSALAAQPGGSDNDR